MQNNGQDLLLIHRENFTVPTGEDRSVHCKIAKVDGNGTFIERPRLVCFGVKKFDTLLKRNLEVMGYTVEILHHPNGKYSNVVIVDKDTELRLREQEIEELKARLSSADDKDKEIARLRGELAKALDKKGKKEEK